VKRRGLWPGVLPIIKKKTLSGWGPYCISAPRFCCYLMNHDVVPTLQSIWSHLRTCCDVKSIIAIYRCIVMHYTFLYTLSPITKWKLRTRPLLAHVGCRSIMDWLGNLRLPQFVASSSNYTAIYSSFCDFCFSLWSGCIWRWYILASPVQQVAFICQHPKFVWWWEKPLRCWAPTATWGKKGFG